MNTNTLRVAGSTYGRPFRDREGRLMVQVWEDDGDRYTTYGVPTSVLEAWALADLQGAPLCYSPGCIATAVPGDTLCALDRAAEDALR